MATSSVNFVNTLGAGSGVDTKALAQSLVDAEKTPRKDAIDAKIKKEQAHITGLGAIKSLLSTLQTALSKVNDASDFSSITTSNSQAAAFSATATTDAQAGSYEITVSQIAKPTRLASKPLDPSISSTTTLSGSAPTIVLAFPKNSTKTNTPPITVTQNTPQGIADAINGQTATTGVSAQLVNTGHGLTLVFSGQTGEVNDFTITGLPTDIPMRDNPLQTAQDASLDINGVAITSTSNQITDALPGVSLDLFAPTATTTSNTTPPVTTSIPARLDLNRDTSSIKQNLSALVTAYNDFDDGLKVLGDSSSKVADFGGAMAGDSFLQSVRSKIRNLISGYGEKNKTRLNPATDLTDAWQVGLEFDRNGKMTLNTSKLDTALNKDFSKVVTLFTANQNNQSTFSDAPAGLAGDAIKSIDTMLRTTGILAKETDSANTKISAYNKQLTQLEDRMTMLLNRYTKQFAAMDSIVGESNSTKTSLKSSFEGLMAMYTKN